MNDKVRWLPSCDAGEAAENIATLLQAAGMPLNSAFLMSDVEKPVLKTLRKRLPDMQWQRYGLPSESSNYLLPFADGEFDAVVALDSLARIGPADRKILAREFVRCARRLVVIAVPLGTDLQRMTEESLLKFIRDTPRSDHPVLAAHLKHGLPTPDEAFSWVGPDEEMDIYYGGDVESYRRTAEHFIRVDHAGFPSRWILQLTNHLVPESGRVTLELESVPMRRHRRLYLLMKRN